MSDFVIDNDSAGQRIDVFITRQYPQYARSALSKLFDLGKVQLNAKLARPGLKLRANDKVAIDLSELQKIPAVIDLPIIFEDKDVLVINKPVGIISHARGKYWDEASVASFIRSKLKLSDGNDRAGLVHRLDRATSGVMICAKNIASQSWLQKQFSERLVEKNYQAIIKVGLEPETAIIDMPIARNPKKPSSFRVDSSGKPAITKYQTLKKTDRYQVLQLNPKTGRTHQLRVHLKQLGHPIVGDELYDGEPADRLYLHAESLKITLPNGQSRQFVATLPNEFYVKLK